MVFMEIFVSFQIFAGVTLLFILVSIFTFCAETHPSFRTNMTLKDYADYHGIPVSELAMLWKEDYAHHFDNLQDYLDDDVDESNSNHSGLLNTSEKEQLGYHLDEFLTVPNPILDVIDLVCYTFFTIEFMLRFVFCPRRKLFFTSGLNLVDLLTLIPFYVEIIIHTLSPKELYKSSVLDAIFVMRILRVCRVFRLVRHNKGLQVLVYTIQASAREIFLLLMFLGIGTLVFASLIFYTDHHTKDFESIPHGFWWAIVTMTTVGYGDMVPESDLGHLVGSFCAIGGVLMIAFTVPVIVNNFLQFYQQVQYGKDHVLGKLQFHNDKERQSPQVLQKY